MSPVSNDFHLTDPRRLYGYNLSVPDSGPLRREQSGNRKPFDIRRLQRKVIYAIFANRTLRERPIFTNAKLSLKPIPIAQPSLGRTILPIVSWRQVLL